MNTHAVFICTAILSEVMLPWEALVWKFYNPNVEISFAFCFTKVATHCSGLRALFFIGFSLITQMWDFVIIFGPSHWPIDHRTKENWKLSISLWICIRVVHFQPHVLILSKIKNILWASVIKRIVELVYLQQITHWIFNGSQHCLVINWLL